MSEQHPAQASSESRSPEGTAVMTGCPHLDGFDPLDTDAQFEWMKRARAEAPVFFMPDYDMWCVTRHSDCLDVFRDPETFSSKDMIRVWPPPAELADQLPEGHPLEGTLVSNDPPAHTRIRKLAQRAFTPKRVAEREDEIRGIANELLDDLAAPGTVDLMAGFAEPLVTRSIASIMGVPPEDAVRFRQWTNECHDLAYSGPTLSPEFLLEASGRMVVFDRWIREFIADHRENPRDDITSALIEAKSDDGDPSLTTREVIAMVAGFVAAGSDTTATAIGHATYFLLTDRGNWEEAVADPGLLANAFEESLRYRNSVTGVRRTTTRETVLGGVTIPADAAIFVHLVSANRDAEVFADPDVFDLHREDVREHLGLGIWRHFCLGAPLARLEGRVALECLVERFPELKLAPGADLSDYVRNLVVPSLKSLRVEI